MSPLEVEGLQWDRKDMERLAGPPLYCTRDSDAIYFRDNREKARELSEEEQAQEKTRLLLKRRRIWHT